MIQNCYIKIHDYLTTKVWMLIPTQLQVQFDKFF